jgi:hypothetical protein
MATHFPVRYFNDDVELVVIAKTFPPSKMMASNIIWILSALESIEQYT